ncbi:tyrosine-type recombinase/integrase [Microbacterium sp. NPDC057407]|uniref:tyrosine-type recombinase/integrase n=1 Tax=Microbacterium sp. NPDC057407 TaxID=3346120 RepID=UPI0036710B46
MSITPAAVRTWRATEIGKGKITQTSRAYDLLRGILNTAVDDDLIKTNPCRIRGGSSSSTKKPVIPPTDDQLSTILDEIEPRYRALVVLAANGGLRYGEATALVRSDVTIEESADGREARVVRVRVERAVTHTKAHGFKVSDPKSEAGIRVVAIFGPDADVVMHHCANYTGDRMDALLFPAADGFGYLAQSTFYKHWDRARAAAGRPDMPFHALRHFAGTRYAQAGATPRETMSRLGHSSMGAAMRYQHSGNRDDELAARMARHVDNAGVSEPLPSVT